MNQTRQEDIGRLSVRVLGPLQVMRNGEQVTLGPLRQQAVFLPLVLRPGGILTPEEIIDGVWGETVPASGVTLVRTYVSRLRRILGRSTIGHTAPGYYVRLDPSQVDLTAFEKHMIEARALRHRTQLRSSAIAWEKALELWRGPPLPKIPGPFAEVQRQRMAELHLSALEEYWDTVIHLGRHAEVLPGLRVVRQDHPLRENLTRLLMLACCQSGRKADAIAAFEQTRCRLAAELGVRPGVGLQQLYLRIRSDDSEPR